MKTKRSMLFLVLLTVLSSIAQADLLIVSDIDDTVKQTNSMGKAAKVYHFLKNRPYPHMRSLLNELVQSRQAQGEQVTVVYVSAAYDFMFNAEKFIAKNGLPQGKAILRKLNSGETFTYKFLTISKIIDEAKKERDQLDVVLFGDNSEHDHDVYWQIKRDIAPNAQIFVRDVNTWATKFNDELEFKTIHNVQFFFSERDLLGLEFFNFVSTQTRDAIMESGKKKDLVPNYTIKTLARRLSKARLCKKSPTAVDYFSCRKEAKREAKNLIEKYEVAP
jgi:hypothetical protein